MSLILIASFLFGGSAPVNAESAASPNRKDAAAKAYQRGALNPLMIQGTGQLAAKDIAVDGLTTPFH